MEKKGLSMKRILSILVSLVFLAPVFAQDIADATIRFLDIPLDVSPVVFAHKLEGKGFSPVMNRAGEYEYWEGVFNGENVKVFFDDFRGQVYMVLVEFPSRNMTDAKNEYNQLLGFLNSNEKYLPLGLYTEIPELEDIGRSIRKGEDYMKKYGYISPGFCSPEESAFLREFVERHMIMSPEEKKDFFNRLASTLWDGFPEDLSDERVQEFLRQLNMVEDGQLALSIHKEGMKYHVMLAYLNKRNAPIADGRDL